MKKKEELLAIEVFNLASCSNLFHPLNFKNHLNLIKILLDGIEKKFINIQ